MRFSVISSNCESSSNLRVLTFKIGYTTALDRRIADLVGTKPPADLPAKIQTQNEAATKLLEIDVATSKEFADQMGRRFVLPEYLIKLKCSATSKSFDWRKAGSVTGVRQQQCGNCWAYASMAALEASYLIRNTWMIDGSEQYIVNCAVDKDGNDAGTCSGGWHAGVFDYMISDGVATEVSLADTGTDGTCNTGLPAPYRAVVWDYVPAQPLAAGFESSLPTVDAMKQALCEHGPLAAAVLATDTFQVYTDDVFKENLPDSTLTPVDPNTGKKFHSVNHDVLVIGWDDTKGAWLIKNSWAPGGATPPGLALSGGTCGSRMEAITSGFVQLGSTHETIFISCRPNTLSRSRSTISRPWTSALRGDLRSAVLKRHPSRRVARG